MLWCLPPPLRTLLAPNFLSRNHLRCLSGRAEDPLRILFCGSDRFSIASLNALVYAQQSVPGLIGEIHVAHRPAKPTGRGLRTLREGTKFGTGVFFICFCSEVGGVCVWEVGG